MIISGLEANKMHFKTQCFVYKHSKLAFLITLCYIVLIFMTLISQSRLGYRPTSRINKGVFHEDLTYQHSLFVNNSNNNHYVKNYSTNNRSVSYSDQLNSKTNHINN